MSNTTNDGSFGHVTPVPLVEKTRRREMSTTTDWNPYPKRRADQPPRSWFGRLLDSLRGSPSGPCGRSTPAPESHRHDVVVHQDDRRRRPK